MQKTKRLHIPPKLHVEDRLWGCRVWDGKTAVQRTGRLQRTGRIRTQKLHLIGLYSRPSVLVEPARAQHQGEVDGDSGRLQDPNSWFEIVRFLCSSWLWLAPLTQAQQTPLLPSAFQRRCCPHHQIDQNPQQVSSFAISDFGYLRIESWLERGIRGGPILPCGWKEEIHIQYKE